MNQVFGAHWTIPPPFFFPFRNLKINLHEKKIILDDSSVSYLHLLIFTKHKSLSVLKEKGFLKRKMCNPLVLKWDTTQSTIKYER